MTVTAPPPPRSPSVQVCKSAFEASHIKDWIEAMRMGGTGALPLQVRLRMRFLLTQWPHAYQPCSLRSGPLE